MLHAVYYGQVISIWSQRLEQWGTNTMDGTTGEADASAVVEWQFTAVHKAAPSANVSHVAPTVSKK